MLGDHLAGHEVAVAEDDPIGHVARPLVAGADDRAVSLEHRGVVARDRAVADRLARDVPLHDPDPGQHELVAVAEDVAQARAYDVVLAERHVQCVEGLLDRHRRDRLVERVLAAEDDGELLGVATVIRRPSRVMPAPRLTDRCARSKLRLISLQRSAHVGGHHPVRRGVAVDVELQRLAVADRDRGAVGDRLVDGWGDLVVALQRDALGREDLSDRVSGRGHVLDVTVHVEGHRAAHRGVADGRADHGRCCDRRGGDQRCLALADACELLAHNSPDVVLSGPREWRHALSHASAEAGGTTSTQGAALRRAAQPRRRSKSPDPGQQSQDHTHPPMPSPTPRRRSGDNVSRVSLSETR